MALVGREGQERREGQEGSERVGFSRAFVVIVISFLAACAPSSRTPPNVLLITLDTTRADHLGAYGYRSGQTPRLDRLAADGVLFERAIAAAPITLPAHTSLLTAQYPFVHGVRNNGAFRLAGDAPTLATVLHDRGYRTAAFVSAFVLDRRFGLARGFDEYDDRVDAGGAGLASDELERRGDRTAQAAGEWLERGGRGGAPFFLWLHLYDAHDPYEPPPPYASAFADHPYDGEIAFDDAVVSSMLERLDRLGLTGSTLVAVVGDHGESLGDHEEATHALFVYESAVRVPLILAWPGRLPAGVRVKPLVRAIDVAPTILELAGAPSLARAQGQSLVPLLRGGASGPAAAYSETYFPQLYMNWAPLRALQDDRWKFIDAPTPELYDLAGDPNERSNLAAREPGRAAALKHALDALTGGAPGSMAGSSLDREAKEKLVALGYIGAATDRAERSSTDRPDPKAMVGVFNRLRRANAALQARRFDVAEMESRSVLESDRSNAFAIVTLARAEMEQGRCGEAIVGFREYAALVPTSADAHHWIAVCHSRLGQVDRALKEEDAALAIDPRFDNALTLRGGLLAGLGRMEEAIAALRQAVAISPGRAVLHVGLARVLADARKRDEAEAEYKRALALQPDNPDAHLGYGELLATMGDRTRALQEIERALALRPDDAATKIVYDQVKRRQLPQRH